MFLERALFQIFRRIKYCWKTFSNEGGSLLRMNWIDSSKEICLHRPFKLSILYCLSLTLLYVFSLCVQIFEEWKFTNWLQNQQAHSFLFFFFFGWNGMVSLRWAHLQTKETFCLPFYLAIMVQFIFDHVFMLLKYKSCITHINLLIPTPFLFFFFFSFFLLSFLQSLLSRIILLIYLFGSSDKSSEFNSEHQ